MLKVYQVGKEGAEEEQVKLRYNHKKKASDDPIGSSEDRLGWLLQRWLYVVLC